MHGWPLRWLMICWSLVSDWNALKNINPEPLYPAFLSFLSWLMGFQSLPSSFIWTFVMTHISDIECHTTVPIKFHLFFSYFYSEQSIQLNPIDHHGSLPSTGVYVIGFSYPVVPKGKARIRVQISAAHTDKDIDHCVDAFIQTGRKHGVISWTGQQKAEI